MNRMAFVLAIALAAAPAFAKGGKHKEGQFCSKKQEGKTVKAKGGDLTCKADDKGKLRWTK